MCYPSGLKGITIRYPIVPQVVRLRCRRREAQEVIRPGPDTGKQEEEKGIQGEDCRTEPGPQVCRAGEREVEEVGALSRRTPCWDFVPTVTRFSSGVHRVVRARAGEKRACVSVSLPTSFFVRMSLSNHLSSLINRNGSSDEQVCDHYAVGTESLCFVQGFPAVQAEASWVEPSAQNKLPV